jgi:glycosyltransferase involved in cell wall biosynthesis
VRVRRFPVARERNPKDFGRRSTLVFTHPHSIADELAWLKSEGPASPRLIRYLKRHASTWDYVLFFSYRYYHAWHGARAVPSKAILVPTAERDPAAGLSIFGPLFRGVRAVMYNSLEERALIHAATSNQDVPGVVVGIGSEVAERPIPQRFRRDHRIKGPFAIYVGRIDENKGCRELFDYFERYARTFPGGLSLVLLGNALMPIPSRPWIKHLGYVSDEAKFDAIAASDLLIMPSYYESLSMVALEAWALGKPVLANGKCDVLRGQCIRSNAGLYYETFDEFAEALYALEASGPLNAILGRNGRDYFRQNYAWPVIERKYLDMFERLKQEDLSGGSRSSKSLPGWFARRRRDVPPAEETLAALPGGPVVEKETRAAPSTHAAMRSPRPDTRNMPESRGPKRGDRGPRREGRRWHRSTRSSRR